MASVAQDSLLNTLLQEVERQSLIISPEWVESTLGEPIAPNVLGSLIHLAADAGLVEAEVQTSVALTQEGETVASEGSPEFNLWFVKFNLTILRVYKGLKFPQKELRRKNAQKYLVVNKLLK